VVRVATLLFLALPGCGVFSATYVKATVAAADGPIPRTLAGASVSIECPQIIKATVPSLLGKTDARGYLDFREPAFGRWIHDGCDLLVEMPGYKTRRLRVEDVCAEYAGNHCVRARITARLTREPSPSDAP
jgi:hypothetical protein